MTELALDLQSQGRYAEAEKLAREALGIEQRVNGPGALMPGAAKTNWLKFLRRKAIPRMRRSCTGKRSGTRPRQMPSVYLPVPGMA
jgi:hypothetical protein